uniref:Uncharacterized protein n=1 Tax=Anguilla anguilla TaxID=7936 RepID=A0A0E9QF47_ANGAN
MQSLRFNCFEDPGKLRTEGVIELFKCYLKWQYCIILWITETKKIYQVHFDRKKTRLY